MIANNKAIYQQIADRICDDILAGRLAGGGRLPSVREYAAMVQVNPNTVMRTYDMLARDGIIFNRRGVGYFVDETARGRIRAARDAEFLERDIFAVFDRLALLDVTPDELARRYAAFLADRQDNNDSNPPKNYPIFD